jgi:hypothetical protein
MANSVGKSGPSGKNPTFEGFTRPYSVVAFTLQHTRKTWKEEQMSEKRSHHRTTFFNPITCKVRTPAESAEDIYADLLDISDGGVCIVTERAYESDSFLMLRIPPYSRLTKVRWVSPDDDKFKMGLKFE